MTKVTTKTYRELKNELDSILSWFESPELDIDEAIKKHDEAKKLITEIEKYLNLAEQKIKKV